MPRRAHELERPRGAAAFRQHRALEQHRARDRRPPCRASACSARASPTARRSRRRTSRAASPSIVHDFERRRRGRSCSLNRRASSPIVMPWRIGIGNWPDERFVARHEQRPLDVDAVDRIGPVAHDHRHAVPRARAQAVRHRVDVGVDPRADVLQIDDEHVERRAASRRSARAFRCTASRRARGGRDRRGAASRSCCPARRTGSRAAGRRSRPASRRRRRRDGRRRGRSRGRQRRDCRRCRRARRAGRATRSDGPNQGAPSGWRQYS